MTRTIASQADRDLLQLLQERGLSASAAQLERWRHAALLPPHARRGLGRGMGSTSVLDLLTVEIADVLARNSMQGRDLRVTVLTWYMRAGTPSPHSRQPIPEPPFVAVRDALVWALRRSPVQRLIDQARRARDDIDADDLYTDAEKLLARSPGPFGHPGRMREALLADDQDVQPPPRGLARGLVHLIAALGLPPGEVSAKCLAAAFTNSGLLPQLDQDTLAAAFEHAERDGILDHLLQGPRERDAVAQAASVDPEALARAREIARILGFCGSLYLMHGLLLPDTPGQKAIRAVIDELGVGEVVLSAVRSVNKVDAAYTLSMCMEPWVEQLADQLNEAITENLEQVFRSPGELDSAEALMNAWRATFDALADQSQ
ncbi:hypothetical protein [Streptomyces vinaceus]|uniref:hypothetical protein n=1 Tax=Streptomyces vinaceus TaxID=1960 RepID=UPI0036B5FBBE